MPQHPKVSMVGKLGKVGKEDAEVPKKLQNRSKKSLKKVQNVPKKFLKRQGKQKSIKKFPKKFRSSLWSNVSKVKSR